MGLFSLAFHSAITTYACAYRDMRTQTNVQNARAYTYKMATVFHTKLSCVLLEIVSEPYISISSDIDLLEVSSGCIHTCNKTGQV